MTERSIFAAALDLADPAERAAYLDRACAGDPALRAHVEGLLAAEPDLGSFLARPPAVATVAYEPIAEGAGSVIGRYKLLQPIGEGGFGSVYMAEQREPVKRRVALKIIKLGMDTKEVVARFEAERQALALMDHPNIAKVLDAGSTDTGRPFFVMELVKGVPITTFCDENHLPAADRLKLFVQVCQAVQHAHQKGVIHRDLKPSNVLVTLHDGTPVPKVIDFGVAKALNQELTERTLFTAFGHMIGTPQYMSPEQAEMSGLDIDTRSDVYSLGVLLFELLTGTTPLEGASIRTAGYAEMQRLIKEQEAPRPSQRVSTLGERLSVVARDRSCDPGRLGTLLRGELDWIVLRALEKERGRRYESASGFAADVQRYLSGEPVQAVPPTAGYRVRKFVRRHRARVAAAAAVVGVLVIGVAGTALGLVEARYQRDAAQANEDRANDNARAADARRADAEGAAAEATAARDALRRSHYVVSMNLIQAAWDGDNLPRVLHLLDELRPAPGEEDLRGFEWHYWDRLCRAETRVTAIRDLAGPREEQLAGPDGRPGRRGTRRFRTTESALSADGTRLAWWREPADDTGRGSSVRVVDAATGREVRSIPIPAGSFATRDESPVRLVAVAWVALNPDGSRVAFVTPDKTVVYDTAGGTEVTHFGGALTEFGPAGRRALVRVQDPPAKPTKLPSADGGFESSAPPTPVMTVFDLADPAKVPVALQHEPGEYVQAAAFLGDGSRLVGVAVKGRFGSVGLEPYSHTICIWDPATGQPLTRVPAGDDLFCTHLAVSPDGARLALLCARHQPGSPPHDAAQRVHLFRVSDRQIVPQGVVLTTDTGMRGALNAFRLAFSPDSATVALFGRSVRGVRLFDSRDGSERQVVRGRDAVNGVAFTARGALLTVDESQGSVREWEIAPPAPPRVVPKRGPEVTVTSHAGRRSAVYKRLGPGLGKGGGGLGDIAIRDRDGKEVHVFREHAAPLRVSSVLFSPDDRFVLSASSDGAVKVWEAETGKVRWSFVVPPLPGRGEVASVPTMSRQQFAAGDGGRLLALPTATGTKVVEFSPLHDQFTIEGATEVYFNSDASRLLSWHPGPGVAPETSPYALERTTGPGELKLWDVAAGIVLWSQPFEDIGGTFVFDPDRRLFAVTNAGRKRVEVRDATTGAVCLDLPYPGLPRYQFNRGGSRLLCYSYGGDPPAVWDTRTGKQVCRLDGIEGGVFCILDPDGKRVVTFPQAGSPSSARLWDATTGRELLVLPAPRAGAFGRGFGGLSFSPDGHRLVTAADPWTGDGPRTIWDGTPRPGSDGPKP